MDDEPTTDVQALENLAAANLPPEEFSSDALGELAQLLVDGGLAKGPMGQVLPVFAVKSYLKSVNKETFSAMKKYHAFCHKHNVPPEVTP